MRTALLISFLAILLSGCGKSAAGDDTSDAGLGAWEAENPIVALPTAPLGIRGDLTQIASAPTPSRARLGRWLFFDPRLSADDTVSCASCHQSAAAFSQTTSVSTGIHGQLGTRKAPTLVNLAFVPRFFFFWDGRATSLEAQASQPIVNPVEMGMTEASLLAKLQAISSYPEYFSRAFGSSTITMALVTQALAAYERTRMSGNSPFDQWQAGRNNAYPLAARQGFAIFGRERCNTCHNGQTFSDGVFHNTGVAWNAATSTFKDLGRSSITGNNADRGAFKTPSLRDLTKRAPYAHDGSQATLADVVTFYNQGGIANPNLDPRMAPLNLSTAEMNQLVAFLQTLDGEGYEDVGPASFPQ